MSYPDLGCFAECLTCELCEQALEENADLDFHPPEFPEEPYLPESPDPWAPEESPGPWWGSWEPPSVYPTMTFPSGGATVGVGGSF